MPQEWQQDDDDRLPAPGEEQEERVPRMFAFDTDGDEIDHLCVEFRRNTAWERAGDISPDMTKSEFFNWLVEGEYAPATAKSPALQVRVYPQDIENGPLVSMTGKAERGPKVLKIPFDNADLRDARKRAEEMVSAPPAPLRPAAPAVTTEGMAMKILADQLAATQRELAEMRRQDREESAARAALTRNSMSDALTLHNNVTADGISTLKTGYEGIMEQSKAAQNQTSNFMSQQMIFQQQQFAQQMAAREKEMELKLKEKEMELKQRELDMKERERERLEAAKERDRERQEAAQERERLRQEAAKAEADRREREDNNRMDWLQKQEDARNAALADARERLEREEGRQREHMALMLGLIEKRSSPEATNMSLFGQVGDMLDKMGINPGEKLKGLLSGDQEEAQESFSDIMQSVAPVAQTALQGLFGWLQSRNPAAQVEAPPPPPPPALPEPTPIPNVPPMSPQEAQRLLNGQSTPTPALPAPGPQTAPAAQPDAAPAPASDAAADPFPPAEMRAARQGMAAVIEVVSSNPEPAWDDLLKTTLTDHPATVALLRAWGIARCVTDAEGPPAKIAALREHLGALGLTNP